MATHTKPITLTISILLLLSLAVWTGVLFFADLKFANAKEIISQWQSQVPAEDEWNEVHQSLVSTQKLDPDNPHYHEMLASLYFWKSYKFRPYSNKAIEANQHALEYSRQALALRPSWPKYWASIIKAKNAMLLFDDEMQLAIKNAAKYGPWNSIAQRAILRAGLSGWPFLEPETRQTVTQTLERALESQANEAIGIALDMNSVDKIMPMIEASEELKAGYNYVLAIRKQKADKARKMKKENLSP